MKVKVDMHSDSQVGTVSISVEVEGSTGRGYNGENAPMIGAIDKAMNEARKTMVAVLEKQ